MNEELYANGAVIKKAGKIRGESAPYAILYESKDNTFDYIGLIKELQKNGWMLCT